MRMNNDRLPILLDEALLRGWPLPMPGEDADKDERGRLLIVGGSREIPGALVLAATAAVRAGAGKLTLATAASSALSVALAVPEARVIALPETAAGGFSVEGIALLAVLKGRVDAVLIGPGMQDEGATSDFVRALLPSFDTAAVILDALAMNVARCSDNAAPRFEFTVALTPHAGELAHLTFENKEHIVANAMDRACSWSHRLNAVIALKGACTHIAAPDGGLWRHDGGNSGLATSGSGDTLAGIIAGLACRGASLSQACAWGVVLHARAGDRLAQRLGPLGYLARELAGEIPALLHELAAPHSD